MFTKITCFHVVIIIVVTGFAEAPVAKLDVGGDAFADLFDFVSWGVETETKCVSKAK